MKNIKFNLKTILLTSLLSGLFLTGCEDYLDQDPLDSVTEAVYYQTPEQFENAANYFYTRLGYDNGDESSDLSGNISDTDPEGHGVIVPPDTDGIWGTQYANLRKVNQLLEKAGEYTGEQSDIAASVGAAYFFRAWHHYTLLKRFGGVPIVTDVLDVDSPEVYGARNSRYEVAFQIFSDLDMAISNLPSASSLGDSDAGKISAEGAKSLKARVLLYEATWDKYVGEAADGDGVSVGAGSAKPAGYPSVSEMLTDAKQNALEVMNSGDYSLWDHRADIGENHLFYLFNLEDGSNPAGLTKADNKEFIFQTIYDFTLRNLNKNHSHAKPVGPSRKMMDTYLCTDGLPVQYSSVFQGYDAMTDEFQNRDFRLVSFVKEPLKEYWGYGDTDGGGAQYGVDFADAGTGFDYRYVPQLQSPSGGRNVGYMGRKFVSEHIGRIGNSASPNYPQIRLAEVMLIYAEAAVELGNGTISDGDLAISINKLRERAGVADLTNALIAPFADLTMLGEIRRERAIELDGENFRFDDLKRWNIAAEELNRNVCVTYIEGREYETAENPKNLGTNIWIPGSFPLGLTSGEESPSSYAGIAKTTAGALILDPASNRNWSIYNYVSGIPLNEIFLNPALVQNPGW